MKKALKSTIAMAIVLQIILGMTALAYAAPDKKELVEEFIRESVKVNDRRKVVYSNKTVKENVSEEANANYTSPVILSDGVTVVFYSPSSLDVLYDQARKYAENKKVGEKVGDITNNMGLEADTGAAAVMLSGFKPILELGIGIIVVLITFGMTVFSSFDICYIAFPVFRNKMEDARQMENKYSTKKSANGEVSLRWVTDDAQYAVTQGTIESGKSPWTLYFKKRIASYIFLGITLFILLTGNISVITDIAINVVSGIVSIISGLAS